MISMLRGRGESELAPGVLTPGEEVLPGYEVVALLSHGRRLDTYDAYSHERDCRCVVKVLRADRRDEPRVVEATRREGQVATTLTHPHLVRAYEAYDDPPAVVLEVLTGATLDALLEEAPLPLPDVAGLALQLTSVLSYLHRHDWLHLDIKPSNIVVEHGRVTLIDLSMVSRPGNGRRGAGTRGYLAPEQARGEGLSGASDVWGLGVTLMESLTGELPHGDEATWDSRRRVPVLHRRAPGPPRLPDDLPVEVAELLLACVALDPAARPSLADLKAVLGPYSRV